jgi:hypothetical protein
MERKSATYSFYLGKDLLLRRTYVVLMESTHIMIDER